MKNAIDIIHDEHRALAAVLHSMRSVIDGIDKGRYAADFRLLSAMIEYVTELPERVHHPKEDGYLFAKLRLRAPEVAFLLDELQAEHRNGAAEIAELEHALIRYQTSGAEGFAAFRDTVNKYVASQFEHMNKEEGQVMPLARKVLKDEDWAEIGAAFSANASPWAGVAGEYEQLFSTIVNLAPPPIGVGPEAKA
jgi:branched-chain amino acid transport system ATP-binding protein